MHDDILRAPLFALAVRLASALALALGAAPALAQQVWTAPGTEKILPSATPTSSTSVAISAAGNEYEPYQIAVTGPATGVTASATSLTGPGGTTISQIRLYREALINITTASALDGGTGPYPDPLVPDVDEFANEQRNAFPFDVPAGQTLAIWVDVLVPPKAPGGTYTGSVTVSWDGGSASVPVTLTVWPFSLPSTSSLRSAFGFEYGAIPAEFNPSSQEQFSTIRAEFGAMALEHRISLSHFDDGDFDISDFATYYAPEAAGTAPTQPTGASLTAVELLGDPTTWAPYFESNGWINDLFQYTCDEPPATCAWSDIPTTAAAAHDVDPNIRTLVTTTIQSANANGVTSSIDILVPLINYLNDKPNSGSGYSGNQLSNYTSYLAGSPRRQLWSYQSCMSHGCGGTPTSYFTGWPTYVIDANPVRTRAMSWLLFQYNLTGELYYETAEMFGQDPWQNVYAFGGNGDGTLFYPGTPAEIGGTTPIPVASIRLKLIREGREDYEYLKMVSDLGDPATAQAQAAALFPTPYQTDVPESQLMAAREVLANRIVQLLGQSSTAAATGTANSAGVTTASASGSGGGGGGGGCGSTGGSIGILTLYGLFALFRPRRKAVH